MLILKLSTLRIETSQFSLNINKSKLNSVTIFNNISELIKDKEIVNDFKSNIKEELIVNKGALF
jgi:hypothetical protein